MDSKHHRSHHRHHHRSDSQSPPHHDSSHRPSHRSRSRSRSRSPLRHHHSERHHSSRHHRSLSPRRHHKRTRTPSPAVPVLLPFNAPPLTKHALDDPHVREIFADYLDIQKGLILCDLESRESKGRFKRFVTHYNRGELARGWYDRVVNQRGAKPDNDAEPKPGKKKAKRNESEEGDNDSEDEVVGPFLPGHEPAGRTTKVGPRVPTVEDLGLQREQMAEDASHAREDLKFERKQDRKAQSALLDELVPRAAAGTHERRIEKKQELNAKMKSFREKSPDVELDDSTLMGGGEGGTEGFKQKKAALERKKNDRELRKEQLLQARIAEREERMMMHRVKEEKTMAMLKQLATKFH